MPKTLIEWTLVSLIFLLGIIISSRPESQSESITTPRVTPTEVDAVMALARLGNDQLTFPAGYDSTLFFLIGLTYASPSGNLLVGIVLTKDSHGRYVGDLTNVLARPGSRLTVRVVDPGSTGVNAYNRTYILTAPTGSVDPEVESLRFVPHPTPALN